MTDREGASTASPLQGVSDDELTSLVDDVLKSGKHITTPTSSGPRDPGLSERLHKRVIAEQMRQLASSLSGGGQDAEDPARWYFEVNGKQLGPVSLKEARSLWNDGVLGPDSYCWHDGFSTWVVLSRVTELAAVLAPAPAPAAAPEPLPPSAPAVDWRPAAAAMAETFSQSPSPPPAQPTAPVVAEQSAGAYYVLAQPPAQQPKPKRSSPFVQSVIAGVVAGLVMAVLLIVLLRAGSAPVPGATATDSSTAGQEGASGASDPLASRVGASPGTAPADGSGALLAGASGEASTGPAGGGAAAIAGGAAASGAPTTADGANGQANQGAAGNGGAATLGGASGDAEPIASAAGAGGPADSAVRQGTSVQGPAAVSGSEAARRSDAQVSSSEADEDSGAQLAVASRGPSAQVAKAEAGTNEAMTTVARRSLRGSITREPADVSDTAAEGGATAAATTRAARTERAGPAAAQPASAATAAAAPVENGEAPPEFGDDAFERAFGGPAKRPRRPDIYIPPPPGEPELPKTLSQAQVLQVVLSHKPDVQRCIDAHRAHSDESGRLVMRWRVSTAGNVVQVEPVSPAHLVNSELAQCLEAKISDWRFPRHQEDGEPISMPFAF